MLVAGTCIGHKDQSAVVVSRNLGKLLLNPTNVLGMSNSPFLLVVLAASYQVNSHKEDAFVDETKVLFVTRLVSDTETVHKVSFKVAELINPILDGSGRFGTAGPVVWSWMEKDRCDASAKVTKAS